MYDSWSGKTLGVSAPDLPGPSGALHVKNATFPMTPGLLQRGFEEDPFSGKRDIEQPLGQNYYLASGNTLPAMNPGQYYSRESKTDFTLPRVVAEFDPYTTSGSGLPSNLNDAYPALTHNVGLASSYPLPGAF